MLLFFFEIFGAGASEKTVATEVYETTFIEQDDVLYKRLANNSNKALVDDIKLIYPIGESLSSLFKEAGLILTKDGIAGIQLDLSKIKPLGIFTLVGTWGIQNGITQCHVTGTGARGLKITMDGILQPSDNGLRMNGIFTASVRDARHVEHIDLLLAKNPDASPTKWSSLTGDIDKAHKAAALKQSAKEKRLLSEPIEWIGGVPVPTNFDVDVTVKLDGVKFKPMKAQLLLNKVKGLTEPTVSITLATEGSVVAGWSGWVTNPDTPYKSSKAENSGFKVTTNDGHIRIEITSLSPFGSNKWYVKSPEYPDAEIPVSVDEGVIDIQLDKKGKKVSGTINAKGKVLTGNRVDSIFSADFSGNQQGTDLIEKVARYVGARPFDGQWNIPKTGKLILHQQHHKVSGTLFGGTIEEGIVTDSIVNLRWKTGTGGLSKGFLSAATDGLLVGMTWNEKKSLSFEPVVVVQTLPTNQVLTIENDAQARKLKSFGYDLASIGKHQEAAKILLPVVKYYQARAASLKNDLKADPTAYMKLNDNLASQVIPLNDLIRSSFEAGDYQIFFEVLPMVIDVQREMEKSKADPQAFNEQLEQHVATLDKSVKTLDQLKAQFDEGITMLSTSGIGVNLDEDSKGVGIKISGVSSGMPASRADVAVGDLIVAIDRASVAGMNTEQGSVLLRGESDSSVSLKLLRDGQYHELKLIRTPLVNMSSEQREEFAKNMTAIRDFVANTGKHYHGEIDKLNQSKAVTDISVAFKKLITSIEEHQKSVEDHRSIAIALAEQSLSKSSIALNLFQRSVSLYDMMIKDLIRDGNMSDKTTALMLKLDQEEEAFKKNPNISEINKGLYSLSINLVGEFDTMRQNARGTLKQVKLLAEYKSEHPSPDAVETANTLAGLATWLDAWRSRMVTDAAKIASLDLGQDFYAQHVHALVEMNLPEQALLASESARARAFADLLARSPSLVTGHQTREESLTSLSVTKTMTLDEIRQLVRDTGTTVVEYFVLKDSLLTWVITPPKPNFKDVQFYQVSQQVINNEVVQITKQVVDGKVIPIGEPIKIKDNVIRNSLKTLKVDDNKNDNGKSDKVEPDKIAKLLKTLEPLTKLPESATQKDKNDRKTYMAANEIEMTNELKSLYDVLVAPIEQLLPKNSEQVVTLVPHDRLFRIPFAALARSINKDGKIEHYLVEDHALTYAPSLAVLNLSRQMKRQPVVPSSLLATIKPALEKDESGKKFTPLPTLEDIGKATINFYEPKSTVVLSDLEATQTRVLAEAPSRDVVLFYTHAKAIDKDPLASYIALTKKLLTAETISKQHLNARLVILAACQTGRGEITGDGVQSVARMFMVAGAKTVMVSLWSVPQDATLQLMYAFHKAWKGEGFSVAASLRQAQLQLLEYYPNQVPMWAGFVIIGDGQ